MTSPINTNNSNSLEAIPGVTVPLNSAVPIVNNSSIASNSGSVGNVSSKANSSASVSSVGGSLDDNSLELPSTTTTQAQVNLPAETDINRGLKHLSNSDKLI